jgi:hypothetical protein
VASAATARVTTAPGATPASLAPHGARSVEAPRGPRPSVGNIDIARIFEEIADLLQIQGENSIPGTRLPDRGEND